MDDEDVLVFIVLGIGFLLVSGGNALSSIFAPLQSIFTPSNPNFSGSFPSQGGAVSQNIIGGIFPMQISQQGIAFIKRQEGFSAYAKSDGKKQQIGYGHDILPAENFTQPMSEASADNLLQSDLTSIQSAINSSVTVQLSQSQFDALCDFCYNVGINAFTNSTLVKMLNNGNYAGASQQFSRWVHSNGQVNNGLVNRRTADANLFNNGSYA